MNISALSLGALFSLNQLLSFGASQHKETNQFHFDENKFLEHYNKLDYEQQKILLNNEILSIISTISYKYKFFNTNSLFINEDKIKYDLIERFKKLDKYKLFQIKNIFVESTNKFNVPLQLKSYFNQKRINITIKFKYLNEFLTQYIDVTSYTHNKLMDEKFDFLNLKDTTNLNLFEWYATFLKQNNFQLFNNISEKLLTKIDNYNQSYLYSMSNLQEYFWELALKLFIKNHMWKKVREIGDAITTPKYFYGSINGWDIVKYYYFPIFLMSAVINILPTNQEIISKFISNEVKFRNIIADYIRKIDKIIGKQNRKFLTKIGKIAGFILDTYIIAYETDQHIRSISNYHLNEYVFANKEQISRLYGFSTANNFEKFITEGFSNGFLSKIHTTFGVESIKDRAFFIYDKKINKNWNLDSIVLKSQAKFRKWFPVWETYTEYGSANLLDSKYSLSPSDKGIYSLGAINASQGTWVGTYFGNIERVKENYYTIHRNGDWLEYTSLNFEPRYTRISNSILEKRFINETFEKFKILSRADYLTYNDFNDYEQWEQYSKNKSNLKNHRSSTLNNIWTNKLEKILISGN